MAGKRILHVEDNPSNRKAVRHILRQTDFELTEAFDGEEGVRAALESPPDLILLDIQLPKLSGYDVAQRLRADERTRHVPIIAITSYALSGDEQRTQEAGCDDYIAKPYRPMVLLEHIKRFLNQEDDDGQREDPGR
jgi:two-component system cell cycle response regulator DivK